MYGSSGSYGSPLDKHVRVAFHLVQIMIYAPNELTRICHDLIRPTCESFQHSLGRNGIKMIIFRSSQSHSRVFSIGNKKVPSFALTETPKISFACDWSRRCHPLMKISGEAGLWWRVMSIWFLKSVFDFFKINPVV